MHVLIVETRDHTQIFWNRQAKCIKLTMCIVTDFNMTILYVFIKKHNVTLQS